MGGNVHGRSYGFGEYRSERVAVRGEEGGLADQRRGGGQIAGTQIGKPIQRRRLAGGQWSNVEVAGRRR